MKERVQRLTVGLLGSTFAWIILGFVAGCAQPSEKPGISRSRPNLILISIDTLRADRMSLYGYSRPTTPHLDEMGTGSVVFDRFYYSGGGTLPSHLTMFTSLYPLTHGARPGSGKGLADSWITLAEVLQEHGYATAGFADAGWVLGKWGFSQGFETFDDEGGHLERILPKVVGWLESNSTEPFFLFFHTYDVHSKSRALPYECPGDYEFQYADPAAVDFDGCREGKCASELLAWFNSEIEAGRNELGDFLSEEELTFISSLYDGCINYVDDRLADFFGLLRQVNLYEPSLIVLISDHGEEFGEHGMVLHHQGGYEELSRIPLIMKLPKGVGGGRRVPHLAATVDLMPTILELLDIPVPDQAQGKSLVPAIFKDQPVREGLHMYTVLLDGTLKFFSRRGELYDLSTDPQEQNNLYQQRPELVRSLQQKLDRKVESDRRALRAFEAQKAGADDDIQLTEEEKRRLKALGYLQ